MAKEKDVVFSSEREEQRNRLKTILIPVAALLLIIAIVAGIAYAVRVAKGESFAGPSDSSYPYTWSINKKGVMTLEITQPEGSVWRDASEDNGGVLEIVEAKRQPKGKHRFTLTPLATGRALAAFRLSAESGDIAEIKLQIEVDSAEEALTTEVLSSSERKIQGTVNGGEETLFPYSVSGDEDGNIVIHVTAAKGNAGIMDWQLASDNESAAVPSGVFSINYDTDAYVAPGTEPGKANVTLASKMADVTVTLACELDANGDLTVTEHSIAGGTEGVDWRNPTDAGSVDGEPFLDTSSMVIDEESAGPPEED